MINFFNYTYRELKLFSHEHNIPINQLDSLIKYYYFSTPLISQIAKKNIETFKHHFSFNLPEITKIQKSSDGTIKFLFRFEDQEEVETVLIPFYKRYTVCLSTQVGCAMKCEFCYTGTQGYKRNLSSAEIIGQYLKAYEYLKKEVPEKSLKPNIVFMGQGEPLLNTTELKKALDIFLNPKMIDLGFRQITLSTVGQLSGIKLLKEFPRINIALSLHAPTNEKRNQIIPLNQTYPIESILEELDKIPLMKRQFITYEYLLLDEFNMSDEDVTGLVHLLSKRKAIVNLIPFNPFPGSRFKRPTKAKIDQFKEKLVAHKLNVMIRTTKGDDILAACGQLKS